MNDEEMKKWLIKSINNEPDAYKVRSEHGLFGYNRDGDRTASSINQERQQIEKLEKSLNEKRHQVHDVKEELLELKLNMTSEQLLREKHPGLKELYAEYEAMLDLVKEY